MVKIIGLKRPKFLDYEIVGAIKDMDGNLIRIVLQKNNKMIDFVRKDE